MRRWLVLCSLTGCAVEPLQMTCTPVLTVEAVRLSAALGETALETLQVDNACSTALSWDVRIEGEGFSVEPAQLSIAAGGVGSLEVGFAPDEAERAYWFGQLFVDGQAPITVSGLLVADDDTADADGDGHPASSDCDDTEVTVYPGATETWDTVDQDCDGLVDEDFMTRGTVFFTEWMREPAGAWLELYNGASVEVDLTGWVLADGDGRAVVLDDVRIAPRGRAVLGTPFTKGVPLDAVLEELPLGELDEATLSVDDQVVAVLVRAEAPALDEAAMGLDPSSLVYGASTDPTAWCLASSPLAAGGWGTPGAANDACADADWVDYDGDGAAAAEGDCDETDPAVGPDVAEVLFNALDDDCDGETNEAPLAELADGYLDGDPRDFMGFKTTLSAGDIDGDGAVEVLLGGHYLGGYRGGVRAVPAASLLGASGLASDEATVSIATPVNNSYLGGLGPTQGSVTASEGVELVVVGTDAGGAFDSAVAVAIFAELHAGRSTPDEALLTLTGAAGDSFNRVRSDLDLDGDGLSELVVGERWATFGRGDPDNYKGRVSFSNLAGQSGTASLDDADGVLLGDTAFDYLGASLGGADLDDDGYDDLLLGAPGASGPGVEAGVVHLFYGGADLDVEDAVSDVATASLWGTPGDEVGGGQGPCVLDVDDDGLLELAIPGPQGEVVYVLSADQSGTVTLADAATVLDGSAGPGQFGHGLACGDFDGDGQPELAVGAPADDSSTVRSDVPGRVYVFWPEVLVGELVDLTAASLALVGEEATGGAGQVLLAVDVDDDAVDDLVISSPNYDTGAGRAWLVHALADE